MNYLRLSLYVLLMFLSLNSFSADRYWIANGSTITKYWNSSSNWSTTSGGSGGASVPGASDRAIFNSSGTATCNLTGAVSVQAIWMSSTAARLNIGSNKFAVIGPANSAFQGGIISGSGYVIVYPSGTSTVSFSGTVIYPETEVVASSIVLSGSTFNGVSSFKKTGTGSSIGVGGNTFVGNCIIENASSGELYITNGNNDVFSADLNLINSGSSRLLFVSGSCSASISGNLSMSNTGNGTGVRVSNSSGSSLSVSGNCTLLSNSAASSSTYIAMYGGVSVTGTLDITNGGTASSTIFLAGYSSSSANISGTSTITNSNTSSSKTIYLGYDGDITFNGVLNCRNFSNTTTSYIYCNRNASSNNSYNDNIIVESNSSSTSYIIFGASGGLGTLANSKTISIGVNGFSAGILSFINFTQVGTTSQSLTLSSTSKFYTLNSSWDGNISFTAPSITAQSNQFNGTAYIEKTGSTSNTTNYSNTFAANTEIVNSGTGTLSFSEGFSDDFQANLIIRNTGEGIFDFVKSSLGTQVANDFLVYNTSGTININSGSTPTFNVGGDLSISHSGNANSITSYLNRDGALNIAGNLNIANNATGASSIIYQANSTSSSTTIAGTTTILNTTTGNIGVINFGSGTTTFNGAVSATNNGSGSTNAIEFGNSSSGSCLFNENIIVESTHANSKGINFRYGGQLASGKTISIGSNGFIAGTLEFRSFTQTGNTAQSLTLTNTANLSLMGSIWGGNVSFTAPNISIISNQFSGTSYFEKNGGANSTYNSLNTYVGNVEIVNSGLGVFWISSNYPDTFQSNLILRESNYGGLIFVTSCTGTQVAGDLSIFNTMGTVIVNRSPVSTLTVLGDYSLNQYTGTGNQESNLNYEGTLSVGGELSIVNNSNSADSKIFISRLSSASANITGNTSISNIGTNPNTCLIELARSGSLIFNGTVSVLNNSVSNSASINFSSLNGTSTFNENITLEGISSSNGGIIFNHSTLANGKTISIGALGFTTGHLIIKNFIQNGTTPQNITLTGTGYLFLENTNWGGNVTLKAPEVKMSTSLFNGTSYIEKTGPNTNFFLGGNIYKENAEIVNSGDGTLFIDCRNDNELFEKNLIATNQGSGELKFVDNDSAMIIKGDLTLTNSGFGEKITIINHIGDAHFHVEGSTNIINNSAALIADIEIGHLGGTVTFDGSCTMTNNCTGSTGRILIGYYGDIIFNGPSYLINQGSGTNKNIEILQASPPSTVGSTVFNNILDVINTASATYSKISLAGVTLNDNTSVSSTGTNCDGISFNKYTIASGAALSIGSNGFTDGSLNFSYGVQLGNTPQSLTLSNQASFNLSSSTWDATIDVVSPQISVNHCTYNADVSYTKTGTSSSNTCGTNTFNGNATFIQNGSGNFNLAEFSGNTYLGNLNITINGTGELIPAYDEISTLAGNLNIISSYTTNIATGTNGVLKFNGTSAQSINRTGTNDIIFGGIDISNLNSDITLNTPIQISNSISLNIGIIVTSSTNNIIMLDNAVVNAVSDNSYVDGPMSKIGDDAFTFPVGGTDAYSNSHYAGIGISAPASTTDQFTAEYSASGHASATTYLTPLTKVSEVEYWQLSHDIGSGSVNVSLYWGDGTRSGIGSLSDLRVAHWNGSAWEDVGNTTTFGTITNGSVTSSAVSSFSPFTFGTIDNVQNPLPIELIAFDAKKEKNSVRIDWTTVSETNNDYFIIERSLDLQQIEEVTQVNGAGNSNRKLNYFVYDNKPFSGKSYYRLIQVDFDGNREIFDWKMVNFDNQNEANISIVPNPSNGSISYLNIASMQGNVQLEIRDIAGRLVYDKALVLSNKNSKIQLSMKLESGVYFVNLIGKSQRLTKKWIVKK